MPEKARNTTLHLFLWIHHSYS